MAGNGLIRLDTADLRDMEGALGKALPKQIERAARIALSRTRRGTKNAISTLVRNRGRKPYNIKAARLKRGISITPIRDRSYFIVRGSSKPISLTSFAGTRSLERSGKGVSVEVLKGKRTRIATGFIRQPTGGKQVFRRAFKSGQSGPQVGRYPIKRLTGPSIATMMEQNAAEQDLGQSLSARFETELARAIRYALR